MLLRLKFVAKTDTDTLGIATAGFAGTMPEKSGPLLEKQVDDCIAPILVIEEDKERPVHQPRPLLQLYQEWCKVVVINNAFQLCQGVHCSLPILQQNLCC